MSAAAFDDCCDTGTDQRAEIESGMARMAAADDQMELSPWAMLQVDPRGKIVRANTAFALLLERDDAEGLEGTRLARVIPARSRTRHAAGLRREFMRTSERRAVSQPHCASMMTAGGRQRWVSVHVAFLGGPRFLAYVYVRRQTAWERVRMALRMLGARLRRGLR